MDFAFSDEQEQLREIIRKYLSAKSPELEVRRLMDTDAGYDPDVWRDMAEQLGLQGLIIPERHGGSGYGFLELSVVLEEMGRALLCAPYFSTVVLATQALLESGDEAACTDYLPGIASGETVATCVVPMGLADPSEVTATTTGGSFTLDGVGALVLDGLTAGLVLVPARVDGDSASSLFAVDAAGDGIVRVPRSSLDPTRKVARLEFHGTSARLIGTRGAADAVIDGVLTKAAVALASEQVGICQWALAASTEYARDRVQFGRPIGSFQAIKHKCVEMLVRLESAKALAYYTAWAAATGAPDLAVMSSVAKAECSEAAVEVTLETLHVHGGIGFTWEHPSHLYMKRAACSNVLFGDPAHHRELVCQRLGI